MSKSNLGSVYIKQTCVPQLKNNLDRISVLFSAELSQLRQVQQQQQQEHSEGLIVFEVQAPISGDRSPDYLVRLQKYVDEICREGCVGAIAGEDSSYDSDYEAEPLAKHQDVSRTTSDTLAEEYAEYVQSGGPDISPGYTARVEFALKLGYTEKLVQAALQKLGASPGQNELLAELIKLGAHRGGSCDNSPIEGPAELTDINNVEGLSGPQTLRHIVIDGSNVAMSHGNKETFSCRGIKICVDWFKSRGHKKITVFVPKWRKEAPRPDNPIQDQDILTELERERLLVFTPSRLVNGKRMVCYDDRYILKLAAENDGVVVSNDNYRDLCQENAEFRKVVEERILMYSFVNDRFMPPDDPLGRSGPTLDNFLRTQPKKGDPPPPCPYAKKCTYGNKCKYHHPERGPLPHKSVTERLSEHAQRHLQAREGEIRKTPLGRTRSNVPPPKEVQHPIVSKSRSVDNVGSGYLGSNYNVGGNVGGGQNVGSGHNPGSGHNVGGHNAGGHNTGGHNTGGHNTGGHNTGGHNTGGHNTGGHNTGGHNTGGHNIGGHNTGGHNTGGHNVGSNLSSGHNMGSAHNLGSNQYQNVSTENLHRKLQRQLTLNPTSDPRLVRRYPPPMQSGTQLGQMQMQASFLEPGFLGPPSWGDPHQHVTRIASAPDSYRPWPPANHPQHRHMQRMSSCSDPQLNVWPPQWSALSGNLPPGTLGTSQGGLGASQGALGSSQGTSPGTPLFQEDARRKLHYHLAAIFPEEQVTQVMQQYPEETNPQEICAAILTMFPKS